MKGALLRCPFHCEEMRGDRKGESPLMKNWIISWDEGT